MGGLFSKPDNKKAERAAEESRAAAKRSEERAIAQEGKAKAQEEALARSESEKARALYRRKNAGRRSLIDEEETGTLG